MKIEDFLKKFISYAKNFYRINLLFSYLSGILIIPQAWFLATIIDQIIFKEKTLLDIYKYLIALLLTYLIRSILSIAANLFAAKTSSLIKKQLRNELFINLRNLGPSFIKSKGSGALTHIMSDGIESIGKYYSEFLPSKFIMMTLPLTILLFAFPFDWISCLVMIITAPLIPLFMIIIGKQAEKLNQKQWQKLKRMGNHFLDVIQGITTLKLFNASKKEIKSIANTAEEYRIETMKVLRVAFLSSVTLEFFSTVSIAIIAVLIGFRLLWVEMEFFNGFFILLLAPEFYQPLRKMGTAYHAKMESIAVAKEIESIFNQKYEYNKTNKTINYDEISIEFKNIDFSYENRQNILNNINFKVDKKEKVALVGSSGSGKSTIFSLILGFISQNHGEILINNTSIADIDINKWQKNISWIPQNPTLFYGSIIDNIRFSNKNISDQEVIDLCQKLEINNFIENLPQGYYTIIGEKGYGLSGGQIQSIAIARAFLRNSSLILMDEPTASLDKNSEKLLYKAINQLSKEKTVITIAHRLNTIKNADKILFLDSGKIVDQGTHDELILNNSLYAKLVSYEILDLKQKL